MKGELLPGAGSITPFMKIELCLHKEGWPPGWSTVIRGLDSRRFNSLYDTEIFHKTRVLWRHFHASCCIDMHITWDLPSFGCSFPLFFNVLVVSIPFFTPYTHITLACMFFVAKLSVLSWVDLDFSLLGVTSNRDSTRFAEFDTIPLQPRVWEYLDLSLMLWVCVNYFQGQSYFGIFQ